MNKSQLIEQLAKKAHLSRKEAKSALETTFDLIMEGVTKSGKVGISGFGTFVAKKQKATERMNPQTGKKMQVPSKTVPKFKAGKSFKDAVSR